MNAKGTALTSNQRKTCFNLCQQFLTRLIRARLVKQFCHLVTGKDNTLHILPRLFAVLGDVGGIDFLKKPFAFFQGICQVVQEYKEFRFFRNNVGKLSHIYNICLLNCLPEQALHQDALATARVAANQNMRGLVNINNHFTRQATAKNQLVVLIAQNIAFVPFNGVKSVFRRNTAQVHRSAVIPLFDTGYQHIKGAFKFKLFVHPSGHWEARAVICQYNGIAALFFLNQIRGFPRAVYKADTRKIVLHFQRSRHIANGGSADGSPAQIGKCRRYKHKARK